MVHALLSVRCREAVVKQAKARLKLSGAAKEDAELLSPGGKYDGRPVDYALAKYQFFACSKCRQPYFGGLKACGADGQQAGAGPGGVGPGPQSVHTVWCAAPCLTDGCCKLRMLLYVWGGCLVSWQMRPLPASCTSTAATYCMPQSQSSDPSVCPLQRPTMLLSWCAAAALRWLPARTARSMAAP